MEDEIRNQYEQTMVEYAETNPRLRPKIARLQVTGKLKKISKSHRRRCVFELFLRCEVCQGCGVRVGVGGASRTDFLKSRSRSQRRR